MVFIKFEWKVKINDKTSVKGEIKINSVKKISGKNEPKPPSFRARFNQI